MEINNALHQKKKHKILEIKPTGMAMVPYMQIVCGNISRLLAKYNIKTIHQPVMKSNNMLRLAKVNWNVMCWTFTIFHVSVLRCM